MWRTFTGEIFMENFIFCAVLALYAYQGKIP